LKDLGEALNPAPMGRIAYCAYGKHKPEPSRKELAFFVDRGPGSKYAMEHCGSPECGGFYTIPAHTDEVRAKNPDFKCKGFVPHGPFEFDEYYCGCHGWE
jgi:hypothetical protein